MSNFDKAMARVDAGLFRVFGDPVEIVSTGEIVEGVFNEPSTMEDMGGFAIDFSKPSLSLSNASANKISDVEQLRISGKLYKIAKGGRATDGSGLTILSIY